MVDGSERKKPELAREQLNWLLTQDLLNRLPLLVLANKADLESIDIEEITEELQLEKLKDRKWLILKGSAKTGEGLGQGVDWLRTESTARN